MNSVTMTSDSARALGITHFDEGSHTYVDSTGNLTFGYGHVITAADQMLQQTAQLGGA